jgi:hypothetical protein
MPPRPYLTGAARTAELTTSQELLDLERSVPTTAEAGNDAWVD